MIFGKGNPKKIWHENVTDCPPRRSDVATVPCEIEKSHFQQYSYILLIIYIISQEQQQQPLNGRLSGTTRVGRYQ